MAEGGFEMSSEGPADPEQLSKKLFYIVLASTIAFFGSAFYILKL